MKKLTDLNYKDLIKIIEKIHYKDKYYNLHIVEHTQISEGFTHPDGRIFKSTTKTFNKKIYIHNFKKFPIVTNINIYLDHPLVESIDISFNLEYDKQFGITDKIKTCFITVSNKYSKIIFRKEIKRGKHLLQETLVNKIKKESQNLEQRDRKTREKERKNQFNEAQNIFI